MLRSCKTYTPTFSFREWVKYTKNINAIDLLEMDDERYVKFWDAYQKYAKG
jgi:hypothetical protein